MQRLKCLNCDKFGKCEIHGDFVKRAMELIRPEQMDSIEYNKAYQRVIECNNFKERVKE